jgi:anti-sigma factor RsiW
MTGPESPVTEDELNAYMDGELPFERHAAVEAWLSTHPEDAARVSAWRAHAASIKTRYGGVARESVPDRLNLARLRRLQRRWQRPAAFAAAVLVAFLTGGVSGWFARELGDAASAPSKVLTADALEAHQLYVVEVRHPVEVPGSEAPHLVQWLSKRLGYDLRAPDLGSVGLKLVGGRLLPGPTGAAGLLMYETASGERFTLYSAHLDAPETALRYRQSGQIAAFYWIDNSKAYVMTGPADRDRLRRVAQSAYNQLEIGGPRKGS